MDKDTFKIKVFFKFYHKLYYVSKHTDRYNFLFLCQNYALNLVPLCSLKNLNLTFKELGF